MMAEEKKKLEALKGKNSGNEVAENMGGPLAAGDTVSAEPAGWSFQNPSDDRLVEILKGAKNIAVLGLTPDPKAASNRVARFLKRHNFKIFPVNPRYATVLGEMSRPFLRYIDEPVDIVDIFRRPEHLAGVLEDALQIGAKVVWLQLGIVSEDFARRARGAGLEVVMDRCIKKEYERLILKRPVAKKYVR